MRKPAVSVFASERLAGILDRGTKGEDTILFTYRPNCPPEAAVSITMDVRPDQFDSMGGLLPIFEMNLPEGILKDRIRNDFAKAIPQFDDLDLLGIVGESQIGRLRYTHRQALDLEIPEQSIEEILSYTGTEDLFEDLMLRFARHSGISGVQPKVLVRDEVPAMDRLTHQGATHIVKTFDAREYPQLAANEYLCSQGASAARLPTPALHISDNRQMLAIDRFDRDEAGRYIGIEDFCVLTGRRSHGRYDGSYESVAKRIGQFVSSEHRNMARAEFFLMLAYACAIGNGDAHLKNFSVLYEQPTGPVRLAPAYDLVSTCVYNPRDTLALTLNGTKQFPERRSLMKFARTALNLTPRTAEELLEQAGEGASHAIELSSSFDFEDRDSHRFVEAFTREVNRGLSRSIIDYTKRTSLPSKRS
jgi:serine/threonine-protein kinase HipA